MARGINKVILIGHLGQDPEVRFTPGGSAVTTVNLATSEGWKDKQSGEMQEHTEWHRVVLFGRLAEICGEYARKGSRIYFEGRLRTRKWADKNGQERYTTEIVGQEMQLLDSRGAGGGADEMGGSSAGRSSSASNNQRSSAPMPAMEEFDDDIPF